MSTVSMGIAAQIYDADQACEVGSETKRLLDRWRAGDHEAKAQLISNFTWVVNEVAEEWAGRSRKRETGDVLAPLYIGLTVAVDRLADNGRGDVERFIRDELRRCLIDYRAEISPHVRAADSTNSYRRRKKLPRYGLKRVDAAYVAEDDPELGDVLEQAEYRGPDMKDDYGWFRGPSKNFNEHDDIELIDCLDEASTDDERKVVELLIAGSSIDEIVYATSLSKYRVVQLRRSIKRRLSVSRGGSDEWGHALDAAASEAPVVVVHPAAVDAANAA